MDFTCLLTSFIRERKTSLFRPSVGCRFKVIESVCCETLKDRMNNLSNAVSFLLRQVKVRLYSVFFFRPDLDLYIDSNISVLFSQSVFGTPNANVSRLFEPGAVVKLQAVFGLSS